MSGDSGGVSLVSVGNSALFNKANSEYLGITPAAAGNRKKWTFSTWFYKAEPEVTLSRTLLHGYVSSVNGGTMIVIDTNDKLGCQSDSSFNRITNAIFRDIGWYHIVVGFDAANTTLSIEVNGVAQTLTGTQPSNIDYAINNNTLQAIGRYSGGGSPTNYLEGYLAETVFTDGQLYTATDFGEFDTTGLYWTPKSSDDIKALTFGNNGFYLDNTTNAETDASGNGNNWTNNNTVVTTTHTPTNSAALLNPLSLVSGGNILSIGNTRLTGTAAGFYSGTMTTLPCDSGGKWYWESRVRTLYTTNGYHIYGVSPSDLPRNPDATVPSAGYSPYQGGSIFFRGGADTDLVSNSSAQNTNVVGSMTISVGSIVQLAFDAATQKLWYGINNTWYNSGNPATGANPSSTLTATDKTWYPWFGMYLAADSDDVNMGTNPTFNGAVTAQNNADGNGEGNFYYAPPTGFLAINTNNIAAVTTRTASDTNKYFQTTLYEGNGAGQRVGAFQPFDNTFTVANSALLGATGYLNRTFDEAGNRQVFTLSTWFKVSDVTGDRTFFASGNAGNESGWFKIRLNDADQLIISFWNDLILTRVFKDASQWYHLVLAFDTTQGTAANRLKVYINGVQETIFSTTNYPSQNNSMAWGIDAVNHAIGQYDDGDNNYWHGYFAQTAYIDGTQLAPSSFGEVDTSTNRWVPKDISGLTFGSAGFFLDYADSGNLGDDESGNTNDFVNNNTVTQTTDSPTTNVTVLSPNRNSVCVGTLSNGNRTVVTGSSQYGPIWTEMALSSGKWYWEGVWTVGNYAMIGITTGKATSTTQQLGYLPDDVGLYSSDGKTYTNNVAAASAIGTYAVNDVMGIALDMDTKTVKFYKNNSLLGTVNLPSNDPYYPAFADWVNSQTVTWVTRFASADWSYSAPAGHLAITQDNLAGTDQFISAFSWIKNRDAADNHMLFDRVRGATNDMHSNVIDAQVTNVETVQRFLEAGVQVGNDVQVNTANESYVLWNWMMEATGSGASNEAGSINTTSTLVDTTLGMSISTYTGTGSNATVGHGLGVAPEMMIVKRLNAAFQWDVYHSSVGGTKHLVLNDTNETQTTSTVWNNTSPTSSVFSIGSDGAVNASGGTYVAYCFAPSQFISMGSYVGNGNANGTFTPTLNSLGVPIQPVWTLIKATNLATRSWYLTDNKRNGNGNPIEKYLLANETNVDADDTTPNDFVTGGVKARGSGTSYNNSGTTYIYMAIGTPIIDVDGRIIAGR